MPKKIFQDVTPPSGRSIRRITIDRARVPEIAKEPVSQSTPPIERREPEPVPFLEERKKAIVKKSGRKKYAIITFVLVVLVLGAYFITTLSGNATIKIIPKQKDATVLGDFSAKQDAGAPELAYEAMTLTKDASESIIATSEETVKKKASGTVILYNNYSATPQRLIRNTRLETPEGLIFRIDASVTVPGKATVGGKVVPGSVEVLVLADAIGEEYNVGLADFTIPGFKGDPKFKGFYGRSKTPIAGGFNGKRKTVSDTERKAILQRVKDDVTKKLFTEASLKRPSDSVLLQNAYKVEFTELPDVPGKGDEIIIGGTAKLTGYLFKKEALSSAVAKKVIQNYDGGRLVIDNFDSLAFTMKQPDPKAPALPAGTINFSLKGNVRLIWLYDAEEVKGDLAGKPKADVQTILAKYGGIEKAEVTVRPFWRGTFPTDIKKITIE